MLIGNQDPICKDKSESMRPRALIGILFLMFAMAGAGQVYAAVAMHNFSCKRCHNPNVTMNALGGEAGTVTNLCVGCHESSATGVPMLDEPRKSSPPPPRGGFVIADASNAMISSGSQGSSHRWAGYDIKAAAGAKAPSRSFYYSRYNVSTGKVTCSRCHEPHADLSNVKQLRTSLLPDYCLECHNDWNLNNNHAYLTHPIGIGLPPDPTPGYKTIEVGSSVQLVAGKVYCSSCHGTHFADSNSDTVDVVAHVTNGDGDGHLLRSDGPFARVLNDANATAQKRSNLCQTCHTHKLHGTGTPIGCLDCHGGHSYNGGTPNYFILRDQTTKPPSNVVIDNLRYLDLTTTRGGTKSVADVWAGEVVGDTAGYCERCHGDVATMAGSIREHSEGENCEPCHPHGGASNSFEAVGGCDTCHGAPPTQNVAGGDAGYATGYTPLKNESTTPHAAHAGGGGNYTFSCATCHLNHNHVNNIFQEVFLGSDHALATGNGNMAPTYNSAGLGTCSNVYCHSNGGARTGDASRNYVAATIPGWDLGSTSGAITTCTACHGNNTPNMNGKNSARHQQHVAKYFCGTCHLNTATDANTLKMGAIGGTHVNNNPDVVFDTNVVIAVGATPYNIVTGVCAVYCHSDGRGTFKAADWDANSGGGCTICHAGKSGDSTVIATGAHSKHLNPAGLNLACTVCHTNNGSGTDHVNGTVNYVANHQTSVCNPCHGASAGVSTGNDRQPIWTSTTSVECSTCHAGVLAIINGQTANAPTSGLHSGARISANPHDDSFNNGNAGEGTCETCHTDIPSTAHANGIFSNSSPIITLAANVGFLDDVLTPTCGPTGAMASCHDDGGAWERRWSTSASSSNGTECANCHGDFSGIGFVVGMGLRHQTATTGDANGAIAASHDGTDKCYTCHAYKAGSTTYYDFAVKHRNGSIELNNNMGFKDNGVTVGCTGCHTSGGGTADAGHEFAETSVRWGRSMISGPVADCNSCHTSYGMTHTGTNENATVHTLHIDAAAYVNGCTDCHSNAGSGIEHNNATVNFANKLTAANNYAKTSYYGGTCGGTNGCHDSEAGEWSDGNRLGGDACDDCHASTGLLGQGGYPPVSAKHTAHINNKIKVPGDCSDCHGTNAAAGTHAGHKDGAKTVLAAGSQIGAYSAADGTCTNTCHAVVNGRDWTSGTNLACADCHAAGAGKSLNQGGWPPVNNAHPAHIGNALSAAYGDTANHSATDRYEFGCGVCHGTAIAAHMDGSNTVVGIGWNSGGKTCNAAYCHSGLNASNVRTYAVTPAWNAIFAGDPCAACHGNSPISGAHIKHQVGFHYNAIYSGAKDFLPITNSETIPAGLVTGVNGRNQLRGHGGLLDSDGTPTSTTITCYVCHCDTVTGKANDRNGLCGTCHNGSNAPVKGNAVIADKRKHVNGSVEVQFVNEKIRSKAQVRNNLTDVPELSNNWVRMNLYKRNDGSSYDEQPDTLRALAGVQGGWNGTDKSCQISCHLWESDRGDKHPAIWNGGTFICTDCHTRLPK